MLFEQFKKGILYTAIGKYSLVIIQLFVQAILARLLVPEEFGIVSAINIFLVFFQLLSDFGIGAAIVQNKDLTDRDINSIFSFSIYFALALAIIFALLGYPISLFYNNPVFINVSYVLAITAFFYGILVVPQSLLLQKQNFKFLNMTTVIGAVIGGVTSILLAYLNFSYYAIIIGNTVKAASFFTVFYLLTKPTFKFKFDFTPLKKIYAYSRNQFLFNFVNYFSRNLDSLLIGRYFGSSQLAYYDQAYKVSLYPNQVLTSLITSVVHPIMSEYQDETDKIKQVYLKIVHLLALVGVPLSVFLYYNAHDIIFFLFGNQWGNSVPVFQILALSVWAQMILASTGGIFQSGNRTDLLLISGILSTILNVVGIVIGLLIGTIESVAVALIITFFINLMQVNYFLLIVQFSSSILEFIKPLKHPFLIGVLELVVFILLPTLPFAPFQNLIIKGLIFVVVWIVGLFISGEFFKLKRDLIR